MPPRILIAGIGNIFMGDDAFGVEAVRLLAQRPQPEGVRVVDFGIRGFDLAYALLDGVDVAIMVDAIPGQGTPGTLHVIEAEPPDVQAGPAAIDTHAMDPVKVMRLAATLGGSLPRVFVVGCEPQTLGQEEMCMGLSPPVQAALGEAVALVESLVTRLRSGELEQAA